MKWQHVMHSVLTTVCCILFKSVSSYETYLATLILHATHNDGRLVRPDKFESKYRYCNTNVTLRFLWVITAFKDLVLALIIDGNLFMFVMNCGWCTLHSKVCNKVTLKTEMLLYCLSYYTKHQCGCCGKLN